MLAGISNVEVTGAWWGPMIFWCRRMIVLVSNSVMRAVRAVRAVMVCQRFFGVACAWLIGVVGETTVAFPGKVKADPAVFVL